MGMRTLWDYLRFLSSKRGPGRRLLAESQEDFAIQVQEILEEVIDEIERGSRELSLLCENGLSSVLVIGINGRGVNAEREANSNGHVDITISSVSRRSNRILGEAKIYDGPVYHVTGMTQLLRRYATGRFQTGFVIEYVKREGIAQVVEAIRLHLDGALPLQQRGPSADHPIRWAFRTEHTHSSDDLYTILHFSCNLGEGSP